jgi:iron only hydrogenase large subunit-like protein
MLDAETATLNQFEPIPFDWPWSSSKPSNTVYAHENSGSGGFSDHIFKYAAEKLFNKHIEVVEYKNLRNSDFREVILEENGEILLRFAIANGFKNIQNLVQKLKRGKSNYHYVEVMACPSGTKKNH